MCHPELVSGSHREPSLTIIRGQMLKQVQHDVWKANSQKPTANSQRPTANGQKRKNFTPYFGRWRWVTAAKALGGVDESFGDVPQKLSGEGNIV